MPSFLLTSSTALDSVTVGDLPDELAGIFGDALSQSGSGQGLLAEGQRGEGGAVYFEPPEVERVARHLSELGCVVLLHPDNVRVEFPGGQAADAKPHRLPDGTTGYAVGGSYLNWTET